MDRYHVALFFHLFALVAASAAAGLVHLANARWSRAATVDEARLWHRLAGSTSRVFPLAVLVLLATGAYMIGAGTGWRWSTGWIDAGIVGVILLPVSGAIAGRRAHAAHLALERLAAEGGPDWASARPHDPIVSALSWSNTGLAMAVVFVMATKPPLGESLVVLAIGVAAGVAFGLSAKRSRSPQRVS